MIAGANRERLPSAQCHAGRGFPGRVPRSAAGRGRRYHRVESRRSARGQEDGRDRAHLQARLQVFGVHGAAVLNEAGEEVTAIMGSYGIGIERILCAAIELYHDKDGMVLPPSIAPFQVVVTPVNYADAAQKRGGRRDLTSDVPAARPRRAARRSRRTPRREVQGRRPDRHSVSHHVGKKLRAGHGRSGGAADQAVEGRAGGGGGAIRPTANP